MKRFALVRLHSSPSSNLRVPADLLEHHVQWRHFVVQDVGGHLSDVGLIQVPADPLHLSQQPGLFQNTGSHQSRRPRRQTTQHDAQATPSMHLVFASTLLPYVQGDTMSLLFGADQVHVVGNEEFASTGYRGTPRWHEGGGTKVGGPIFLFQLNDRERNKESIHPKLDKRLYSAWLLASYLLWQRFVFSGSHRRETSP